MTDGRESANADTENIHAEDSPASSPKSLNNNDNDNSIQPQSNQKEENDDNPEEENLLSSSKGNSDNSNQNNLSENSQENTEENTQNKNESQPLEQNTPNSEKNNEIEKQEEQTKSDIVPENNKIENQPPIPISSIIQPTDINEQVEVVLNVFAKATDENNQNDNENDQSQNTKTNSNNEAQNFLRSFSTNAITNQNNNEQPIFHRQISITNSNLPSNEANASPIQQHLSVPLMPLYTNSSTPNNNNSNSLLSFQFLYQQQQLNSKPIVPVIAPNSLFPTSNQNHKLSTSPNAASVIQTQPHKHHHHHHHHHHHKKQQQEEDEQQETEQQEQTRSPLSISPSDLQEILSREDDEPELDLPPQTSAALENFKKTGKLHFNLPSSRTARSAPTADTNNAVNNNTVNNGNESVSYSPTIIRKLQRDKVNAIIKGRYDEAKEADSLSKRVTTAVIESVEEEKRYERLRQAEWKLEDEKRIFLDVHKECIEKVKEEEEALNKRMISLDEIHIAEQKQFEDKWNNEDFLRRFSKPSSSLLQLKAVERSMAIAKMFDEAKVVKSRAEQLEKVETKEKQNRAEQEMKVERSRLLERQKKEKQGLKEKCDNLLVIAKRNMEKEEAPYKQRISRLEAIVAELKSGNESKCKIVPSKVQSSLISPRGSGNELLTARTAFKFSAYKVTAQSMKLKIKPLGCVTIQEKKKSKTSKK